MAAASKHIPRAAAALLEPVGAGVYIRTLAGLLCGFALLCVGMLTYTYQRGELPPTPVSDNLSFSEKAQFLRGLPVENFDMIAAGSSWTLNDLSSDALLSQLPEHASMLNIAAWGVRISETRLWLNHAIKRFGKPKLVLILVSPLDFDAENGSYAREDARLDDYLAGGFQPAYFFNHFSLVNYLKLSRQMKNYRTNRGFYDSLVFDRGGSVPVDMSYPNVDSSRWNYVLQYDKIEERQYGELDRLAAEMTSQGISLICVQPPVRRSGAARENVALEGKYQARVAEILQKNNQTLLDLKSNPDYDDSDFSDSIHLNARGAQLFSQTLSRILASMPVWSASSPLPNR